MRLKKVYLEITNRCNLACPFCIKNKRKITDITMDNYKIVISKIKDYTKELYLHILGEPLIHKDINKFIDYASSEGLLVNITTNGYLINNLKSKNIHRLNISMHSYSEKYGVSIEEYIDSIFKVIDKISDKTFISLRLWVSGKYTDLLLKAIQEHYKIDNLTIKNNTKVKIAPNVVIDTFHEFIWPDMNNKYYSSVGKCKGLIDHIGILSDGTIVPCCLDSMGGINLGNIYQDDLNNIFKASRVVEMIDGFKKGYKCEELCRHCSFLENRK